MRYSTIQQCQTEVDRLGRQLADIQMQLTELCQLVNLDLATALAELDRLRSHVDPDSEDCLALADWDV